MFDVSELVKLSTDLDRAASVSVTLVRKAVDTSGADLEAKWRANAAATSGDHGKWYPSSITRQTRLANLFTEVGVTVGPDTALKQGTMGRGFEYGSINQPPHLDGNKAFEVVEPLLAARLLAAVYESMGPVT